jgi:hypothetical protein
VVGGDLHPGEGRNARTCLTLQLPGT